jgi:hypothetical protein
MKCGSPSIAGREWEDLNRELREEGGGSPLGRHPVADYMDRQSPKLSATTPQELLFVFYARRRNISGANDALFEADALHFEKRIFSTTPNTQLYDRISNRLSGSSSVHRVHTSPKPPSQRLNVAASRNAG